MQISKSRFVAGLQCLKRLYLQVHEPELSVEPGAANEAIMEPGREVGLLAQKMFPGGVQVKDDDGLEQPIRATQQLIANREIPAVFEGTYEWTSCTASATVLWFRLPKKMLPPTVGEGAEHDRFMIDFKKRLSRNPRLRQASLGSDAEVESALEILDKEADDAVASVASAVFLSTAVLQSGRLDVLVVFAAQTRLI